VPFSAAFLSAVIGRRLKLRRLRKMFLVS
jgi:hypothetical protein